MQTIALPRTRGHAAAWTATAVPLVLITALGAVLRLWAFDHVPGNPFYDAAVRSMGQSWHNFFFGAVEPAGQVAIDKTPADLWLQVAFVKLFGFSGVVVRLPEVLAAHSDTMDSLMMLLDVLAAWLVVRGRPVTAGVVLGLAFNVKLFEALLIVPALVVLIAMTSPRRRLIGFGAALAVVGLSWIAISSLIPIAQR